MLKNIISSLKETFCEIVHKGLMNFSRYRVLYEFHQKNKKVVVEFGYHIGKMKMLMKSRVIPMYGYGDFELEYCDGFWVFTNNNDNGRKFVLNDTELFIHTDDDFEKMVESFKAMTAKHYPYQMPPGYNQNRMLFN